MFIKSLHTSNSSVQLIEPDIERDSALGVVWLAESEGRKTLKLMGVADEDNHPSTLEQEQEQERVGGFLTGTDQYNWMISLSGKVVGAVWVDLKATQYIQAPAMSIMLGDPEARGKGVGRLAGTAVTDFLKEEGQETIYARHLVENGASKALLTSLGFKPDGASYRDGDQLLWQNVVLKAAMAP